MSKRDEMRKLREMRMKQLSEADRSTPAEDAARRAEEATSENITNKKTTDKKTSEHIDYKKLEETLAKNTEYNYTDTEKSTIINKEENTPTSTVEHNNKRENSESSVKDELNDKQTSNEANKGFVTTESANISRLDYTYRAKDQNCGLTHTTIMLTDECRNLLKTRSLQMGMSQQDYFNMLIEEDRTVVENATDELTPDTSLLAKIDLHGKKSKNITVTIDNYKFMKKAAALRGISQTNYANYLILKEHQREEIEGRRPGKYD